VQLGRSRDDVHSAKDHAKEDADEGKVNQDPRPRSGTFAVHKTDEPGIRGGRTYPFLRQPQQESARLDHGLISAPKDQCACSFLGTDLG
jgi:hypothetical protein